MQEVLNRPLLSQPILLPCPQASKDCEEHRGGGEALFVFELCFGLSLLVRDRATPDRTLKYMQDIRARGW